MPLEDDTNLSPDQPEPRDDTHIDESPEIELGEGHEYTAGEFPDPSPLPKRRRIWPWVFLFLLLCAIAAIGSYMTRRDTIKLSSLPIPHFIPGVPAPPEETAHDLPRSVEGVTQVLEPVMRERFQDAVEAFGLSWPPTRVRLVGLKMEKTLEMWVADKEGPFHLLKSFPVLAASGDIGPKRRQGDRQVPEGHYRLVYLNAESKFHLSLLLDYPNSADKKREQAAVEEGVSLGGDICVHGSNVSIGCLAIGDPAIEEVFTMVALAESSHRDIIILPADLRKRPDLIAMAGDDTAALSLYSELANLAQTVSDNGQAATAITGR